MLVIWLGAGLFILGLLFMAAQVLGKGPLSLGRRIRGGATLEPPTPAGGGMFGLSNWPGIALMVIGGIMLLAGAAFWPR